MRWIVRLVVLLVAFALGRQLWSRQVELLAAKRDLDHQRAGIKAAEGELDTLDRSIDESEVRLRELEAKIRELERQHPGGIPPSVYPDYSRLVAEHNDAVAEHNELVARARAQQNEYSVRVDRHNARVADANSLAAESTICAMLPERLRPGACDSRE